MVEKKQWKLLDQKQKPTLPAVRCDGTTWFGATQMSPVVSAKPCCVTQARKKSGMNGFNIFQKLTCQ